MLYRVFFLLLLSFSLVSCDDEVIDNQKNTSISQVLYSVMWGWEYQNVSVLIDGRSSVVGEFVESACKNGKRQGSMALCSDKIVHPATGRVLSLPYFLHNARSVAAGTTDRIAYLLDSQGDLHLLDTRWEATANDSARLLLWSKELNHFDILAGNARRHLASVELDGQLLAFLVHEQHIYVLYRTMHDEKWAWGVEKINTIDFTIHPVVEEVVVESSSEIPDTLDVVYGRLRVLLGSNLVREM